MVNVNNSRNIEIITMPEKFVLANEFGSSEVEESLLAAIAKEPDLYWKVVDLLPKQVFVHYQEQFEDVVQAIEKEDPLPTLQQTTDPSTEPEADAHHLVNLYQKRLLAQVSQRLLEELHSEKSSQDIIKMLEGDLNQIQQSIRELSLSQLHSLDDVFEDLFLDVVKRHEAVTIQGKSTIGLPTGIPKLDEYLGGLQTGIHLLSAPPGHGKTTITLQIAANVARSGAPVLFVSFEESLNRLALKVICQEAGLEMKPFSDGYGEPEQLRSAYKLYKEELNKLHFIDGSSRLTASTLKAKALQLMNRHKAPNCLIIVDYLQRWASCNKQFNDFRHVVSGLVSDLRDLALRLDSPILVISSQNRSGQGSASLVSLKESGDLEYSADSAIFLTTPTQRTAFPPNRPVDIKIEKNRYGDKGVIEMIFKPHMGSFKEFIQ